MAKNIVQLLKSNIISGLTVGLVSVPIAIALAVASHASPVAGIITALWAGLMASLFGGSNYNIIGPTGALAGLLLINANTYGPECLPVLALLSGFFIFLAYLVKLEKYLMFIPASALQGFILGIAIMIVLGQINAACGLAKISSRSSLVHSTYDSLTHMHLMQLPTFLLFLAMFLGLVCFARLTPRLPGTIILAPLGILVGYLSDLGTIPWKFSTIGSAYAAFSPVLFQLPKLHFSIHYIFPALSIALISILETMISARIADGITKTKHNKRKEMLGLSLANIVCGLAGGIPATAALARTALNIRSGCTNKISATISSLCVGAISLLFLNYFYYLPLAVIAAILVFVAMRMLEMENFLRMFRADKKQFALSLIVAFVTIYEDATIGILLGAVIAMILFMEKLSMGHHEITIQDKNENNIQPASTDTPTTLIYGIKGPLAYINVQAHVTRLENLPAVYSHVILNLHDVHFIDLDGIEALSNITLILAQKKIKPYLVGLNPPIKHFLNKSVPFQSINKSNIIFPTISDALLHIDQQTSN